LFIEQKRLVKEIALCSLFASLVAAGSFIKINTPWMVPFTLQFPISNAAALILGGRLASLSIITYVLVGLMGFPIFSCGGGFGYIFKPTFGYILGFIFGSYVCGTIIEKFKTESLTVMIIASFINLTIVHFFGVLYGYLIMNYYLDIQKKLIYFLINWSMIFLPSDFLLCVLSSIISKKIKMFRVIEFKNKGLKNTKI
jgi:biotin transport system substrate-specific component